MLTVMAYLSFKLRASIIRVESGRVYIEISYLRQ